MRTEKEEEKEKQSLDNSFKKSGCREEERNRAETQRGIKMRERKLAVCFVYERRNLRIFKIHKKGGGGWRFSKERGLYLLHLSKQQGEFQCTAGGLNFEKEVGPTPLHCKRRIKDRLGTDEDRLVRLMLES